MPTPPSSTAELIDLIRKSGTARPETLARVSDLSLPGDPQKAATVLVEQGVVTRFQATQLLAGRHKGFRIGAYTILDMLGRGGMGAVYLAEHLELHRKVAIKILVPGKEEDQKLALERFLREARSAAALDHPNIVRIFDVARHQDVPYLVMEYVEGETLQQLIDREGPLPYPTATEFIAQAAAGLQHAFEKGFVHRDVKPGNLMRDNNGTIKILDMGLARSDSARDKLTALLDNGAVVGTADFIAPEQAINNPGVDIRADVYSLGATYFALIIGKPPFDGNTTQKLLQHQLKNAPTVASLDATLPKGLSLVIARMLAKKPVDRYQTPAEVIDALTPWMGNSARILVGLSRTSLGQGAILQEALSGISRKGSSRRLPASPAIADPPDLNEVDPSEGAQETTEVASSPTTRETNRPGKLAKTRSRTGLLAGIGLAVLVFGGLGGWLAFGRERPRPIAENPDGRPRSEQAQSPGTTNPGPPRTDPTTPVPKIDLPIASEKVVYQFDGVGQKPFLIRSGLTVDPGDPGKKTNKILSQTGPGEPPSGWVARCWNKDSEMDFFAEGVDGKPTLGIRNLRAPPSAMLFTPAFNCPTGTCRLKVEYQTTARQKLFVVKFKPADERRAWEVATPQATGEVWRVEDLIVDLKGAPGGYFEFHNTDGNPNAALRLRSLVVTELKPSAALTEGILFKLDAADLPAFKTTRQGYEKTAGDDAPRLRGVGLAGYKKETVSEWTCGPIDGVKAIGFTNVNEVRSAQISIELENESGLDLKLAPNQKLRARVAYRTAGKGQGAIYFQTYGDWKVLASRPLPNSNSQWQTVDLSVTRADRPIRCVIDVTENGIINTLFVSSITITDVGRTPPSAPDLNTWAEGPSLYSLDVAKIPAFRVQKEHLTRTGGEAEVLPSGIGCNSWKETAIGEFRCDKVDEIPALMVTNLNDEKSAQFFFQLEGGMKLPFQPGKGYRVKVGYSTRNDAVGAAVIQVTPGYKGIASATLPATEGKWKMATVSFLRPPAEDNVEVRMVIDNNAVGEGNTLCIRSIEIVELISPEKK